MAIGSTTTSALADSLPTLIFSARQVREYGDVMTRLVDRVTLPEGTGLTWHEVAMAKLTAQAITETTVLNNPQQMSDTDFAITPTQIGIQTRITDRVALRISKNAYAKLGSLGQNAIERKKDKDGLIMLDAATTSLGTTAVTLQSGNIFAGISRILGNTTEPGHPPIYCVLHPYQTKDIMDELLSGVGTYPIGTGLTTDVYRQGFRGMIGGAQVYEDGNISIASDAKGGVFAKDALVLVQGRSPRAVAVRKEEIGGGATDVFHYDEYAYGERCAGYWLYELISDATAPSS